MTPITVALVFGGANSEHEVSCKSAASMLEHLDRERYLPVLIGIGRDGSWHRLDSVDDLATATGGSALPDLNGIDVAIPVLHGRMGEDGTVQGLFELAGVRYVGSGVLASALCMDKAMCQRVLAASGLPVVPTEAVTALTRADAGRLAERIGYPVFVKPNRAGSSVGASRVDAPAGLEAALDLAFESDTTALIQPVMDAAEVDLGVLEHPDGGIAVGEPLRIRTSAESAFFDYHAKYTPGGVVFEVPAVLPDATRQKLDAFALDAFRALGCAGLARVDFFVGDDGAIAINEVNTFPGMTALSQYPRIWAAAGIEYSRLIDVFIERALTIQR
jgi:D-alanine-D-alanine ligase